MKFVIHNPKTRQFWNRGQKTIIFASRQEALEHARAKGIGADALILELKGISKNGQPVWDIAQGDWLHYIYS